MYVIIINGSPRVEQYSNTNKIIDSFTDGLRESGISFEKYAVSKKNTWDKIKQAYCNNTEIIIALPLYVECVPGLLLEFLETLPVKNTDTRLSFILQSGFAEACQLRCGEEFLEKLCSCLGVTYGGTVIHGDNFGIRVCGEEAAKKLTSPYKAMGTVFATGKGFDDDEVIKFAGPEVFALPMRIILQIMFMTAAKKKFREVSAEWGCTEPINAKPWGDY